MTSVQDERTEALASYRAACAEFDQAQEQWDPYLASVDASVRDPDGARVAFARLELAHQRKQDALDGMWLAWRNRQDTDTG